MKKHTHKTIYSFIAKVLAVVLAVLLILIPGAPAGAAAGGGAAGGEPFNFYEAVGSGPAADKFFADAARIINSSWDDNYFSIAEVAIGGSEIYIDGAPAGDLSFSPVYEGGELLLSTADVADAIGVEIAADLISSFNASVYTSEGYFGEYSNKGRRNRDPLVLNSEKIEEALGVEIHAYGDSVIITKPYQLKQIILFVRGGKALADSHGASKSATNGNGAYFLQYPSEEEARAAFEAFSADANIQYAVVDQIVMYEALSEPQEHLEPQGPAEPSEPQESHEAPEMQESSEPHESPELQESSDPYEPLEPQELPELQESPLSPLSPLSAQPFLSDRWGAGRIAADRFKNYLAEAGKTGGEMVVAVIDTGVDVSHPMFAGRTVPGVVFEPDTGDSGDDNGHGTHVSGTIVDCTPESVKIMPIKSLDRMGLYNDHFMVSAGIKYAADNGAKAINMSLGGFCSDGDCLHMQAIKYAADRGTVSVAAAGNYSMDASGVCPAKSDIAVTVSAFDIEDVPAPFSDYGACVDIAAPGVDILSSYLSGGYLYLSGTSMATAHVSASAAMLMMEYPDYVPRQIKEKIKSLADPITVKIPLPENMGEYKYFGSGILNFDRFFGDDPFDELPAPEIGLTYTLHGKDLWFASAVDGANIYFTVDGSEPERSDYRYNGIPIEMDTAGTFTIKAIAVKGGMTDSTVASRVVTLRQAGMPAATPGSGDIGYEEVVSLISREQRPMVFYTLDGTEPDENSLPYVDPISLTVSTAIAAKVYSYGLLPSEIAYFNYKVLDLQLNAPIIQVTDIFNGKRVSFVSADSADIYFTTDGSDPKTHGRLAGGVGVSFYSSGANAAAYTINAYCKKADMADSATASAIVTVERMGKPVANPAPGRVPAGTAVALLPPAPGAEMYYTLDGSDPGITKTRYTQPIAIGGYTVITARAYKDGMAAGEAAVFKYEPDVAQAEAPEIIVNDGAGGKVVTFVAATAGVRVYATLDGSTPGAGSMDVTGRAINLEATKTVKAIAIVGGLAASSVAESVVAVERVQAPSALPGSGFIDLSGRVTLSTATPGAEIYYTTDGTLPVPGSYRYNQPLAIAQASTIIARAYKNGMAPSAPVIYTYIATGG